MTPSGPGALTSDHWLCVLGEQLAPKVGRAGAHGGEVLLLHGSSGYRMCNGRDLARPQAVTHDVEIKLRAVGHGCGVASAKPGEQHPTAQVVAALVLSLCTSDMHARQHSAIILVIAEPSYRAK